MLYHILRSMRPRHWVKNAFVFPALVFSGHLFELEYALLCFSAAGCFCLLSSAIYLFNDLFDAEQDRLHPEKSQRPIASGRLPVPMAAAVGAMLLALGLAGAFFAHPHFGNMGLAYVVLNLAYSFRLKHVVIVDVLIVALGYLLRAMGGGVVLEVTISTWFILCSFMLALFLAVLKRRQELIGLEEGAVAHRVILKEYSVSFLDQVVSVLTSATLVCYALYAMGVGESAATYDHRMQWTIPFVLYGILRYLYLVYQKGSGDNPTAVVWKDRPLQINLVLWMAVSTLGIYVLP